MYDESISTHSTPCPGDPGLLTSDPLLSMLRTHYHVALAGSVAKLLRVHEVVDEHRPAHSDDQLRIPNHDIKSLRCLGMRLPFDELASLPCHQEVNSTMELASVMVFCELAVMHHRNGHVAKLIKGVEK